MSDEPKLEAVPDAPVGLPYQVILQVHMTGDPSDPAHLELMAKMTALIDAMRTRYPGSIFRAGVTDWMMGTEAREV